MAIELKVPAVGESITEVEIGDWLKAKGDTVKKDEPIVTLESEKATVELPAPVSGTISQVLKKKGEIAAIGEVIAYIEKDDKAEAPSKPVQPKEAPEKRQTEVPPRVMPAAERALAEQRLRAEEVQPTGPGGRLLKEDVLREAQARAGDQQARPPAAEPSPTQPAARESAPSPPARASAAREEETVPMTRLRRTVAQRLVEAQNTMALLTTFNEIDMSALLALRKECGEAFQVKYHAKLGLMSFFVKASIAALKAVPQVNAEIRGTDIV